MLIYPSYIWADTPTWDMLYMIYLILLKVHLIIYKCVSIFVNDKLIIN